MGTMTTYTSTITVPVYGSWKCEHCGEVNFSYGKIACQYQASTYALRNSKHEEAKAAADEQAQKSWVRDVCDIILNPNDNAQEMRSCLSLENSRCTQCKKKPKWDKNMKYKIGLCFCIFFAIVFGYFAFFRKETYVEPQVLFYVFSTLSVLFALYELRYESMIRKLPKEYTPVFGTRNVEIIRRATNFHRSIPTPEETLEIVRSYSHDVQIPAGKTQSTTDNPKSSNKKKSSQCNFCRKCGTRLRGDSNFCHKCGTEIVK